MKRIIPILIFCTIIIVGLVTYVVDNQRADAEWSFTIQSGERAWDGIRLSSGNSFGFTWTARPSGITNEQKVNYIDKFLNVQNDITKDMKLLQPTVRGVSSYLTTSTKEKIFVLGQRDERELFYTFIDRRSGEAQTKVYPINAKLVEIARMNWAGITYHKGELYLFYKTDNEESRIAIFDQHSDVIEQKNIPNDTFTISEVLSSSWFMGNEISQVDDDLRYIPITLTKKAKVEENIDDSYYVTENLKGEYAYDFEEEKVVKITDEIYHATTLYNSSKCVYGHQLRMIDSDKGEIVIDLRTLEITERDILKGSVEQARYIGPYLYDLQKKREQYVIDVYDESGEVISTAEFKAENQQAQDLLPKLDPYVY